MNTCRERKEALRIDYSHTPYVIRFYPLCHELNIEHLQDEGFKEPKSPRFTG